MSNWVLQEIDIERHRWGTNKGKYKGTIKFTKGDNQSFEAKIPKRELKSILT